MKILLIGAKGQLGSDLQSILSKDHEILSYDLDTLDITDNLSTRNTIINNHPDIVINAAAFTNVDECETNANLAYKVNALGPRNIAVACQEIDAIILHFSTDYVFDGNNNIPYTEFDSVNPINIYGKSKLWGEKYIQNTTLKYFICRTSWLYGKNGSNFVKTILRLAKEKKELAVVNDQIGSPTYTIDLVKQIAILIETNFYGTYHISNTGNCTWFEFACKICELSKVDVNIKKIGTQKINRIAKRPAYSVLRNYCLDLQVMNIMRPWDEALAEFLQLSSVN